MDHYCVKDTCHLLQEILRERCRRRATLASDSCLKIGIEDPAIKIGLSMFITGLLLGLLVIL